MEKKFYALTQIELRINSSSIQSPDLTSLLSVPRFGPICANYIKFVFSIFMATVKPLSSNEWTMRTISGWHLTWKGLKSEIFQVTLSNGLCHHGTSNDLHNYVWTINLIVKINKTFYNIVHYFLYIIISISLMLIQ